MSPSLSRTSTVGFQADTWLSLLHKIPGVLSAQFEPDFTKLYSHRLLWEKVREFGVHRSSHYQTMPLDQVRSWIQHELSIPNIWLENPFYLSMEEGTDLPWIKVETMPGMDWAFSLFKRITPFQFFLMTKDFHGGLAFWEDENLYHAYSVYPKRILKLGEWANEKI